MSRTRIPAEVRSQVFARAAGRCEYCLIHESDKFLRHQIDHVVPLAHGGDSGEANLALACARCNLHKGSNLSAIDPVSGRVVQLFSPRRQRWTLHFDLEGAVIVGRSPTGRASVLLLRMNDPEQVSERLRLQAIGRYPTN